MADNTESRSLPQQPRKKRARHGVRYQMELNFDSDEGKFSFLSRLDSAKRRLARGPHPLDNRELLCNLLDVMEGGCSHTNDSVQQSENVTGTGSEVPRQTVPALPMLDHSGMFDIVWDIGGRSSVLVGSVSSRFRSISANYPSAEWSVEWPDLNPFAPFLL